MDIISPISDLDDKEKVRYSKNKPPNEPGKKNKSQKYRENN